MVLSRSEKGGELSEAVRYGLVISVRFSNFDLVRFGFCFWISEIDFNFRANLINDDTISFCR